MNKPLKYLTCDLLKCGSGIFPICADQRMSNNYHMQVSSKQVWKKTLYLSEIELFSPLTESAIVVRCDSGHIVYVENSPFFRSVRALCVFEPENFPIIYY